MRTRCAICWRHRGCRIKDKLPEDGEANRFNKIGDALDVSHVQMARYLAAADYALREVLAKNTQQPKSTTQRFYTREDKGLLGKMKFSQFNKSPERATFPVLGTQAQPDVRAGKAPPTVGKKNPKLRAQEAIGCVASSYEPIKLKFREFEVPRSGLYRLRFSGYSVWVGPQKGEKWYHPDLDVVSKGRRSEPVTIYGETPPRQLRLLGSFDFGTEPTVREDEPTCSKARSSATTPRACSARVHRRITTRSRPRKASPASRCNGWKSKARSSRRRQAPRITSCSMSCRSTAKTRRRSLRS